jgi:site-specific recombinase XerD
MIAKLVMTQRLTNELNAKVDIAGINWQSKRETFLSDTKSQHTRRAYTAALDRLETWARREAINPLELTAAAADQFIRELKAMGRSAATTRRDIAAVSAFYTWLERYHSQIKNPIRGTRIRPPKENKKETVIPTSKDYKAIIAALPAVERSIVIIMAARGLRAGALPSLELKGGKYHGRSKGKPLEENGTPGITLPPEALNAIKAADLDAKKPFAWKTKQGTENTANAIEGRINYYIGKLHAAGKIGAAYSCHDFRHLFAINEYKKNKDIFRLSKLLNHAGIQVTQIYLKSLGIEL